MCVCVGMLAEAFYEWLAVEFSSREVIKSGCLFVIVLCCGSGFNRPRTMKSVSS